MKRLVSLPQRQSPLGLAVRIYVKRVGKYLNCARPYGSAPLNTQYVVNSINPLWTDNGRRYEVIHAPPYISYLQTCDYRLLRTHALEQSLQHRAYYKLYIGHRVSLSIQKVFKHKCNTGTLRFKVEVILSLMRMTNYILLYIRFSFTFSHLQRVNGSLLILFFFADSCSWGVSPMAITRNIFFLHLANCAFLTLKDVGSRDQKCRDVSSLPDVSASATMQSAGST